MNNPYSESYWLRGFKDAMEGKHEELPAPDGVYVPANRGYQNGYRAGLQKRAMACSKEAAGQPRCMAFCGDSFSCSDANGGGA